MAKDEPQEARQESMGGLAKGLAILEAFRPDRPRLTVTEAANSSGTTPAAARRCLLTLVDLGYLIHDGKFYRPTPRVVRLTSAYWSTATLPALAQPCLNSVRDELNESASVAVIDGIDSLFVARAESDRIVSAGVRVGAALPLWASATGRVLLASLPDSEIANILGKAVLEPRTAKTPVTIRDITKRVEAARTEGVEYTDEELELGVRTMAVPVVDSSGVTHAAMSVSAFAAQVSINDMKKSFLPVLRREAGRLGKML